MYLKLKQLIIVTLLMSAFMPNKSFAETNDQNIIPRKVLFGNPDRTSVSLSHDGKYISYLAPLKGVLNVWIAPVQDVSQAMCITNETKRRVMGYSWAYDNKNILYSVDEKGDENYRLYKYNIETKETVLLTPKENVKAWISAMRHDMPNKIVISLNDRDKKYFDLYMLDLETGAKTLLLKNEKFLGFVIDNNLQVRFALMSTEDGGREYYQFKDGKFESFMKIPLEDVRATYLMGFDKTNSNLYLVDSRKRNTAALKMIDLLSGHEKLLAEDELVDISVFAVHPTERNIQAISINYDKPTYQVLDKFIEKDIKYLTNLDRGSLHINRRTLDDNLWLVAYESDNSPIKYYLYNKKLGKAEFLFTNSKALEQYNLVEMHPVIIKSRDGLNLVSYISFPPDTKMDGLKVIGKKPPLILYVHGGPHTRDDWGYYPTHQWLANRGYAVLSINYRGSTGFGKDFVNAANKEWGGKMHDDLIDGVNWAINNKIAEPNQIAIMGGSYGGYSTLVGLTMTPDIFACGIDLCGISNLLTFIKSVPPYWAPFLNTMKKTIGPWDTEADIAFLNQRSPLTFVDNIKKPLFIAQGANDPRVKQAESDQIVAVMQAKKIPVVYALYEDEGHGLARPENRLSYYALVEYFLAKILGGKVEKIGNDLEGSNMLLNGKSHITVDNAEDIIDKAVK
jgi:dipeptidyl aminopeptidase/acylaminoacyl peptidase